jgi:hypothetical protein
VVDEFEVVATTLADGGRPPAHLGAEQWSSRLLAEHLGISFATVARIWRKWGIHPQHVESFAFATDLQRQAQVRDLRGLYLNLSQRAAALHRAGSHRATEGQSTDQADPWLKLVEVSLGIITQQAIRRGTFASVRNLIDALGALTAGGQDRHEPARQRVADEITGAKADRQNYSDTPGAPEKNARRVVDGDLRQGPNRPTGRPRKSMAVRAEFHGARGRRSGSANGAGG